jgi:hypothetical protein
MTRFLPWPGYPGKRNEWPFPVDPDKIKYRKKK